MPLYVVLTLKRFEQKRKNQPYHQRTLNNRSVAANSLSISLSQTELNNNSPSTVCSRNNTPNLANIKVNSNSNFLIKEAYFFSSIICIKDTTWL